MGEPLCARCGKPAEGYAGIGGQRYCHGDDERPTCYMLASWDQREEWTERFRRAYQGSATAQDQEDR